MFKTAAIIAKENDLFRSTMFSSPRHRVVLTDAVRVAPNREEIISLVRSFNTFKPANDPYGEHDFGSIEVEGQKYFWKIDYYDFQFELGVDPKEEPCARVLTIMRSDEY